MNIGIRTTAACLLAVASCTVYGESQFNTAVSALADDESGRSTDLDVGFVPNSTWSLDAGIGQTKARTDIADIDGDTLRAGVDVHSDRFGLRGYYRRYSDSNNFETDTLGARGTIRSGGFGFSVIAETRGFDVEYTSGSPLNPTRGTADFDANGYGAGLSYAANGWSAYAEGIVYDFDDNLDSYETVAGGPSILGIPVLPGLSSSFVTFKQGALDHQYSAGVERGFEHFSVRVDWTGVEDAISNSKSNNFSAGFRYAITPRVNLGVTAGVTDSDDFGSVNYAGLSLGFSL